MVAVDACTARIADGIWKMPATLAATPLSLYFGYRGKLMRHLLSRRRVRSQPLCRLHYPTFRGMR